MLSGGQLGSNLCVAGIAGVEAEVGLRQTASIRGTMIGVEQSSTETRRPQSN